MIQIVDQLAETANQKEQQEMIHAFVRSSYFELHFWEMAYQHQEWS